MESVCVSGLGKVKDMKELIYWLTHVRMIGRKKHESVKPVWYRGSVLERNACSHQAECSRQRGRDAAARQGLRDLIEAVLGKSSHEVRLGGVAFLHEDIRGFLIPH